MRDCKDIANMKDTIVSAVTDLQEKYGNIVMLDADLKNCLGEGSFQKRWPDRFYECGIAEGNMVAMAGGLSSTGLVPYAHSFGCFISRRAYDQAFISCAYAKQRVHLIGTDPGVSAQLNGGTHMPFEDIALMRQIPDLIIYEPSDAQSSYELTIQAYESGKSSYVRLRRKGASHRYSVGDKIELGKGIVLSEGKDLAIIATGEVMVEESEKAVKLLKEKGISATLIDLHTIKPLDTALIEKVAKATGHVLVCENGRYAGGIGEAVAAHLAKTCPVPMDFVCVGEQFGEVGKQAYLQGVFGFTADNIAAKAEALSKR